MYKNKTNKCILGVLVMIMVILSFKFILINNKLIEYKKPLINKTYKSETSKSINKYGYSDILECLQKNKKFVVKSINVVENETCNVEVSYYGDIKLLYSSLYYLKESKNFLDINKISIDRDTKIANISINFKKNN